METLHCHGAAAAAASHLSPRLHRHPHRHHHTWSPSTGAARLSFRRPGSSHRSLPNGHRRRGSSSCTSAVLATENQGPTTESQAEKKPLLNFENGAATAPAPPNGQPSLKLTASDSSFRLVELPASEPRGVQDYMLRAPQFAKPDGGPPRWFCPTECGCPPQDAPLLLFLPGMDGTGLGIIRHYESLGRMFEVRCLHIPVFDRTPVEGLIAIVEDTLKAENCSGPPRPIYLVGDSLGGSLALAIAARNPNMDLVLVLANPATSFNNSQLQPLLPLMAILPDKLYQAIPFLLSSTMGDPVRMALAKVDPRLPLFERAQALSDNLTGLLPTLPTLADIVPKETLVWKIKLLRSAGMYANSRLHAVKAEVLVLASGKDQMLPSRDEAERLKKLLKNCTIRYYKDSGHTLLLEDGIDLGTVIRGAKLYRKWKSFDPVSDYVYPTRKEFEEAYERNRFISKLSSPVFFSKMKDGSIVRGLGGVPEEGPILLVGYHMLMGIELTPLVSEFLKRKQLIRGIAHPLLFTRAMERGLVEPGFVDDVRVFGAVPATKRSFFKVMSRRESAILYPGGAREALHRKGEAYKLFWPEHSEFVRTAARFGVTIVPFGVVGEDDFLELLLDYNDLKQLPFFKSTFTTENAINTQTRRGQAGEVGNQELHLPVFGPKVPGRMYFLFGKPFQTAGKEKLLQNKNESDKVYQQLKSEVEGCLSYLLKKREEDPYRALFPRILYETLWGEGWQAPTFKP